jgi:hypothetical protein
MVENITPAAQKGGSHRKHTSKPTRRHRSKKAHTHRRKKV